MTPASSATVPDLQSQAKGLSPAQVEYLALEGGGGKGFAYLGALQVLEKLGVMDQVKGFAGASAGAIFALLLAVGYDSEQMLMYLHTTDFTKFFDSPRPRRRPTVGGCEPVKKNTDEETELLKYLAILPDDILHSIIVAGLGAAATTGPAGSILFYKLAKSLFTNRRDIATVLKKFEEKEKKPPFSLLLKHWKEYIAFMNKDMGMFAGCAAREEFERILQASMPELRNTSPSPGITFNHHYHYFRKKKLLLTGTNLSTGKTQIFSYKETPDFPVADAVRISMSLPFIYKPYVISTIPPWTTPERWPECGTYVDGGVWNNFPFREFDGEAVSQSEEPSHTSAASGTVGPKPRTLGLRLEVTPAKKIEDFVALLGRVANYGLFGTGETQVLSKYVTQAILLDTRGLDLVDFNPPEPELLRAIKRARRATWRYFNFPVPASDEDKADDKETENLYDATRVCR